MKTAVDASRSNARVSRLQSSLWFDRNWAHGGEDARGVTTGVGTLMLPAHQSSVTNRAGGAVPLLRREDLTWEGGVDGRPLVVRLRFVNPTRVQTPATQATIQIAAFGAFAAWRPLTQVAVPPVPPGGSRVVTVTSLPDDPNSQDMSFRTGVERRVRSGWTARMLAWLGSETKASESVHMIGNLNVFVTEGRPVERHMHRAIGLAPGCENIGMFILGDGRPDTYTLDWESSDQSWQIELQGVERGVPLRCTRRSILIRILPAEEAAAGRVVVWATRTSTTERVPVEFDLGVGSQAAKCYRF